MSERETQRPLFSRDLPESQAITIVPPRGRRERAPARAGKDKAALADTALPSPAYRQEWAHVSAESLAITNVAPLGAEGSEVRARGEKRAAIAATALPDCLWAEGRTLLPSRWGSKTIIIIIACDNKKIIIGLRTPLSGRHFWDAPRGAARAAQEALGWISRP